MEGWESLINQNVAPAALNANGMLLMGDMLSRRSGADLMQNCDLPPPTKVFPGCDKTVVSPMKLVFSTITHEADEKAGYLDNDYGDDGRLDLLKALRLSQTRAREAERNVAALAKERDTACLALLQKSLQLSAYRHWVRLIEVQVARLQLQWQQIPFEKDMHPCQGSDMAKGEDEDEDKDGASWAVSLAMCLGIAGVGFAFGCRYFWS